MAAPTAKTKRARVAPGGGGALRNPKASRVEISEAGVPGRHRSRSGVPVLRVRRAIPQDGEAVDRLRGQLENLHARLLPDYLRPSSGIRRVPPEVGVTTWVGEADRVVRAYVIARLVDAPIDPAMMPARRVQI